jgi:hypothetical protein
MDLNMPTLLCKTIETCELMLNFKMRVACGEQQLRTQDDCLP